MTEFVTGLDLVETMVRIAAGEPLPMNQRDVRADGWAIEARIYAEDPARNFMPSMGRIARCIEPRDDVRVDSGVEEGSEITRHYDPLLAKLSAHGTDRPSAMARLAAGLDSFHVGGVTTNLAFLAAVVAHPRFAAGQLSTHFVTRQFDNGVARESLSGDRLSRLVAVAAVVHHRVQTRDRAGGNRSGRRGVGGVPYIVRTGDTGFPVTVDAGEDADVVTIADGPALTLATDWRPGALFFRGHVQSTPLCALVERRGTRYRLREAGLEIEAAVLTPRTAKLHDLMPRKPPPDRSAFVLSPMPGLQIAVAVAPGQPIKAGETVAVVEAMKMENVLRAPRDGVVGAVHAQPGSSLTADQVIVEFE